jgi:type I restriction enzyme S subunit
MAERGDIVITVKGAGVGKINLLDHDVAISRQLMAVRAKAIDPNFLFAFLSLQFDFFQLKATGAAIPGLSRQDVLGLVCPLPPLPEQKRIVAILDEAFEALTTATANTKKNLKNARELFDSYLNSIFTKAEGWSRSPIAELATKIGSGATPTGGGKSYKRHGVPLIRSLNVHDRRFKIDDLAFLDDAQAKKLENVTLQNEDVLLNITGASVARCCLAPVDLLPARVNQHVSIIRPIQTIILSRFLEFGLTAKINKDRLLGVGESAGATRQAITKAQIQEFVFSYPSLEAQRAVVEQLNDMGTETEKLETHYASKLESLADLKRSILKEAFSGELTSPPSQATQEAAE